MGVANLASAIYLVIRRVAACVARTLPPGGLFSFFPPPPKCILELPQSDVQEGMWRQPPNALFWARCQRKNSVTTKLTMVYSVLA